MRSGSAGWSAGGSSPSPLNRAQLRTIQALLCRAIILGDNDGLDDAGEGEEIMGGISGDSGFVAGIGASPSGCCFDTTATGGKCVCFSTTLEGGALSLSSLRLAIAGAISGAAAAAT